MLKVWRLLCLYITLSKVKLKLWCEFAASDFKFYLGFLLKKSVSRFEVLHECVHRHGQLNFRLKIWYGWHSRYSDLASR